MTNIAHTTVGSTSSGSGVPSAHLRAGVGIRSKVYQLSPSRRDHPALSDERELHCESKQPRPAFTTKEIGIDSLAALNVFLRAAESCSFTDAGGQLGLSSSAVGKCVARLEQRLGVRLFHRNTRCINLTQEGKALLESCRRILLEIRSVEQELAHAKGAPKGKLRVSMPLNGLQMVPTFGNFIRAYPEVDLDLDFTDSIVDVVEGGYDLVLRSGEVGDSRLKSRRLGAYRFEIVGSPNYFTRAGMPTKPEDLMEHACLHRKHPTTGKIEPWPFAQSATANDFILPMTATASTVDALIYLAESGIGIACVPNFCVRRQIEDGTLVSILRESIDRVEVVRAMWPSSQFQSPKLRVFIDFMVENLLPKLPPNSLGERRMGAYVQVQPKLEPEFGGNGSAR